MGVMACDRKGCDAVLCGILVDGRFYLCGYCAGELDEYKKTWPEEMRASDVQKAIEDFFDTPKGTYEVLDREGIDKEFNRLVKRTIGHGG